MSLHEHISISLPDTLTPDQRMDIARQHVAIEALARLRKEQVFDLPNFGRDLAHNGRITNFQTDWFEEGLYLDASFRSEIFNGGRIPDRLSFETNEMQRIGKDDSRRHVFFGEAQLGYFDGRRDASPLAVAVKPFDPTYKDTAAQEHCMQEIAVAQYLGAAGLDVIKPVGLLVGPGDRRRRTLFMLSETDPNLKTLDTIDWAKLSPAEIAVHLDGAVAALARLHENLVFHGDTKLRNIAMRQTRGAYLLVDLEDAVSTRQDSHPSQAIPLSTKQKMSADLSELTSSVKNVIYRKTIGGNDHEAFEWLLAHVYMPYRRHLIENPGFNTAALVSCFDVIVHEHMQQTLGEWTGRQHDSRFGLIQ